MKIFKLMFLKKKKKLDNKGAALANVLLITTFVMVLTSSVLSMAYNSYRMKLINVNSKDNFYTCEAVLEQVRVAFRNEFSVMTSELEELTDDEVAEVFMEFYASYALGEDYRVGSDVSISSGANKAYGNYYYDVKKVAELLTSITGTDGATLILGDPSYEKTTSGTTAVFTSEIEITVEGYDNINVTLQANATGSNNFELTDTSVTFHDLTVIYQQDGYESQVTTDITIEFPEVGTTTVSSSSGSKSGWKTLDDRVKTYSEWKSVLRTTTEKQNGLEDDPEYADNDFYIDTVPYTDDNSMYINTTDYPANTVTYVMFDFYRYYLYYNSNTGYYTYEPIYPIVQTQAGEGTGTQYAACQQDFYDNVEILVGDDETDDDNWVKFTNVFDVNNNLFVLKDDMNTAGTDAYRYVQYYGDSYTTYGDVADASTVTNPIIRYRVHLVDPTDNIEKCRGWIAVTGGVRGATMTSNEVVQPVNTENAQIYVDIDEDYNAPAYYFTSTGTTTGPYKDDIYFDLRESNFCVGDVLKITLKNVNPNTVLATYSYFTVNMIAGTGFSYDNDAFYSAGNSYGNKSYTVKTYDDYMEIYITMEWDTYPFIHIFYLSDYDLTTEVTLTTEWITSNNTTITTSTGSYADDASIYYEDWRKE